MIQLALAFEPRHLRSAPPPRRRRRGLRLERAPTVHRDTNPEKLPAGYRPGYVAQLEAALRLPEGARRSGALCALADLEPFDLAADLLEEAQAFGWARIDHRARADQAAE